MNLSLKGFGQLIEDMSAALQSSATMLIDVSVGSVARAIFEANASVALWMQWLILQVLQTTRAATSTGSDLDSWMLDFGLGRLPATASTGIVTFSRFAANLDAAIPVGSIVKTGDGSVSFAVTEDRTSSIWRPDLAAYVIPGGVANADLPVDCTTPGSIGNVLAGTINVIAASLPGVDQVNNASPLQNGTNAETDQAFRNRFQGYLATRSRATLGAIRHAIADVRQGLQVAVAQNTGVGGVAQVGTFLVVIDDGTGFPPSGLLSDVATAVDAVRPIGTMFAVIAPQVVPVSVSLAATFAAPEDVPIGTSGIQNCIAFYLNALPIGATASVTRVAQHAYEAGPRIVNIGNVQLNGGSADIPVPPSGVIKAGQITVSINDG